MAQKDQKEKTEQQTGFMQKHRLLVHIAAMILFVVVATYIIFASLKYITRHNQELTVPSFTGMSVQDARELADAYELRIEVVDSVYIPRMGRGDIYKQTPKAGDKVKKNRRIILTVNTMTPKTVEMPSLVGFSLRQARAELASRQLRIGKLSYRMDMATDNVLEQKYRGRRIQPGKRITTESEIELVLGLNPEDSETYIPDLRGLQLLNAKDMIFDNSLNVGKIRFDETVKTYSDSLSAYIYRQVPDTSLTQSVQIGSRIDIYLTKDREKLK